MAGVEPRVERVEHRAAPSARRSGIRASRGVLASITATVSPRPMPRLASAEASRRARA